MDKKMHIDSMRNAGVWIGQTHFAGKYFPANGTLPARYETTFITRGNRYRDAQGVMQETEGLRLKVQVWNSEHSKPGKGIADTFAKNLSLGKELKNCDLILKQFQAKQFNEDGSMVLGTDGTQKTRLTDRWVIDKYEFGNDSSKVILQEVANYYGRPPELANASFDARPAGWDGKPRIGIQPYLLADGNFDMARYQQDQEVWKQIQSFRQQSAYNPGHPSFGYATVVVTQQSAPANVGAPINTGSPSVIVPGNAYAVPPAPANAATGYPVHTNIHPNAVHPSVAAGYGGHGGVNM